VPYANPHALYVRRIGTRPKHRGANIVRPRDWQRWHTPFTAPPYPKTARASRLSVCESANVSAHDLIAI
jgi:hypothetical protein